MISLSLVVAVAQNGVIGRDNQLIWHLRTDLQRFKALTLHKPVLMGRKTYESIGKPLPNRETIVLTRDEAIHKIMPHSVHCVQSLEEAQQKAFELTQDASSKSYNAQELMIAGGAQIYALTLPFVKRIYLTCVHAKPEGDTFFPEVDLAHFSEVSREEHASSLVDDCAFTFIDYERLD
jgi:dihydrofolate reductase